MGVKDMKVVVFSCDSYSWLIPIFSHFYERYWPDNPYKTEFVTETKKIDGVTTFCTGKIPWADRAIKYLESLEDETFLLLLEDYIINATIDTNKIKMAESLCRGDIGCIRVYPHHKRLSKLLIDAKIEGFKEYPLDKPYSVSLESAIWQKEFFLEFLQRGENIWQTEDSGSIRVQKSKKKIIWADIPIITHCRPGGYMKKGRVYGRVEEWVKENW